MHDAARGPSLADMMRAVEDAATTRGELERECDALEEEATASTAGGGVGGGDDADAAAFLAAIAPFAAEAEELVESLESLAAETSRAMKALLTKFGEAPAGVGPEDVLKTLSAFATEFEDAVRQNAASKAAAELKERRRAS